MKCQYFGANLLTISVQCQTSATHRRQLADERTRGHLIKISKIKAVLNKSNNWICFFDVYWVNRKLVCPATREVFSVFYAKVIESYSTCLPCPWCATTSWDLHTKKAVSLVCWNQFHWCLANYFERNSKWSCCNSVFIVRFSAKTRGFGFISLSVPKWRQWFPWWRQIPRSHDSVLIPNFLAGVLQGARDRHVQNRFSTYWLGCQSSMRYQKVPGDMVHTTNNAIFKSIHL
jgi:hypothetical protein